MPGIMAAHDRHVNPVVYTSRVLLVDIGARGGVHPRWKHVVDDWIAIDGDPEVDTGRAPLVIADARDARPFHLIRARPCSSLHRPNPSYLAEFPGALDRFAIEETRTVDTATLDDIAPAGVDLVLKLDVEGAERAILKGAERTLPRVALIETEVWFAPVYIGGALFHDLHQDLTAAGFSLVTLRRCWWKDTMGVPHLTTGDALYVRPEHPAAPQLLSAYRSPSGSGFQKLLDSEADAATDSGW
jgi:hypothetical protein